MQAKRMMGALAILSVCGSAASAQVQFTDVTVAAGLNRSHSFPADVPVSVMHAGLAVGDFNRDGRQDIFYLSGGATADCLFINSGGGTFTDQAGPYNVAASHVGGGAAVGDYNKDGWPDIYVTSYGPRGAGPQMLQNKLYRNNGDGTFTDVAAAAGVRGSPNGPDAWGATFGDYDLDGDLDIATGSWSDPLAGPRLFRNNGNGTFTDVTGAPVLAKAAAQIFGFSPRFLDMDGDTYPELIVASDFYTSVYFRNNGNGTFTDITTSTGTGLENNGMGETAADFNNDGRFDWYVTSIYNPALSRTGNMLYLNQGGHVYNEVGLSQGVRDGGWGWGTTAVDLNLDGRMDIVATNGFPTDPHIGEDSHVFINQGGSFTQVVPGCGLTNPTGEGRGLVRLDYDNDGRPDIAMTVNSGPIRLFRNVSTGTGRWLRVFLDTSRDARLAPGGINAKVYITGSLGETIHYIDNGCNYLSTGEQSVHAGLGSATSAGVRVVWPNGRETSLTLAADQTVTISYCPADLTGDGLVDFSDYLEFLNRYDAGDASVDYNGDGIVDFADYLDFLNFYDAGC
ncbi:MAG: CRTAC1 family protein [Phycisphaerales bacterium]|nr:CRTAC1 family protein [Phycisphaerales bacterium]